MAEPKAEERTAENENGYQSPFALRDYLRNHDFLHVGYKGKTQKTPTHSRKEKQGNATQLRAGISQIPFNFF